MRRSLVVLLVVAMAVAPALAKPILGGTQEGSAEDPETKKAIDFVILNADAQNGLVKEKQGTLTFERVKSVSTQVVAGFNYKIVMDVTDDSTGKRFEVKATVWSRPWLEGKNTEEPARQMTAFSYTPLEGDTA